MEDSPNGDFDFFDLFELIEAYARVPDERQDMALKLIAGSYARTDEATLLPDTRRIVDDILCRNGYFVPFAGIGNLHPQSVYAVLNVALYSGKEGDKKWGPAGC